MQAKNRRIGFVSTRLAGTDGVSLEVEKWVRVLESLGHACFFFAGESSWPADRSTIIPEAHFKHSDIQALQSDLFDDYVRSSQTTTQIHKLRRHLKEQLQKFIQRFDINLLIAENALSIPMNVPLGLALTELLAETQLPAIGHHHDFYWERHRFTVNAAEDFLRAAFPPVLPSLHHVVINSSAGRSLARRTGASSVLVPNVMDFDHKPSRQDDYAADMREVLGLQPDTYFILQPTRIVPRKRIEKAIDLVRRLEMDCALVITHNAGDEGLAYQEYLQEYAHVMGVRLQFAARHFQFQRAELPDGGKIYSLEDAYLNADLVTYPSTIEGFGNAFLETIYYQRPIVMSMYEIYRIDLRPKGFEVIGMDSVPDAQIVRQTRQILRDPEKAAEMCARNYEIGQSYYSMGVLENSLVSLINDKPGVLT
jgi:glycosyltransferase involved in cell wall biosynthesis